MPGVPRELAEHTLDVDPKYKPVKQFLAGSMKKDARLLEKK